MDEMKMIPVIYDCDNTMGVDGNDVDDGLTLLYLLGLPEVNLVGVTCTFGNNGQDCVYKNTVSLLREWNREEIPCLKGAYSKDDRESEAAEFLAAKAEEYKGELVIIATGAMSNLYQASLVDENFYANVRAISIMGGITQELIVNGGVMKELNLSCDPLASYEMFKNAKRMLIANAHTSLESYFSRESFEESSSIVRPTLHSYLLEKIESWFKRYMRVWKLDGFVCWDVMAAAQYFRPELFEEGVNYITPTEKSLETGMLVGDGAIINVEMPVIKDVDEYRKHVYETFNKADVSI